MYTVLSSECSIWHRNQLAVCPPKKSTTGSNPEFCEKIHKTVTPPGPPSLPFMKSINLSIKMHILLRISIPHICHFFYTTAI